MSAIGLLRHSNPPATLDPQTLDLSTIGRSRK